jgi:serine protease AprX
MQTPRTRFTRRLRAGVLAAFAVPLLLSVSGANAATQGSSADAPVVFAASSLAPTTTSSDRLIVRAEPGRLQAVTEELRRRGARIEQPLPMINAVAVTVASNKRAEVGALPGVAVVAEDAVLARTGSEAADSSPVAATQAKDKSAKDKSEKDKADKDKADKDKADKDKADKDKADKDKADKDKSDKDKSDKGKDPNEQDPVDSEDRAADEADRRDKSNDERTRSRDSGSLDSIARVTGARDLWKRGITGDGVDIALIDTGIAPVVGAPTTVAGADLSMDAAQPNLRFLDGFGHGTHMAGIIGGRDPQVTNPAQANGRFVGIAPGARVVNVKVGAMDGTVHTSQVVAALDWVVQNRQANGMNIRVVNLSYGSPATSDWKLDPLAWAAEIAWRRGLVVIAAAGNEGAGHELSSPAYSPEILAVGATEVENRRGGRRDYAVAPYTSTGTRRRPDLYLPGDRVISLRVRGGFIDTFVSKNPVSDTLTRGTGTSQATAVASGLAALLIDAFPEATSDQIKALLTSTSDQVRGYRDDTGIESSVDVKQAWRVGRKGLPSVVSSDPFASCGPTWCRGTGDGHAGLLSWSQAAWNGSAWSGSQWSGSMWLGSQWLGSQWSGSQWSGSQWLGSMWLGSQWLGSQWSGSQWSGSQWSGSQWSGSQWSGSQWSGSQWSGSQWSGSQWSGSQWSGSQWSGSQWSGSQWSGSAWSSTWAS